MKYHFQYDMINLKIQISLSIWYEIVLNLDIIFQDDMIISLVSYRWLRKHDKVELSWYEISILLSAHSVVRPECNILSNVLNIFHIALGISLVLHQVRSDFVRYE